jgi:glycosyltransferase involved in cell wall biosynthesis
MQAVMNNQRPLVSIICPTYNHGKFIAQTLDGFLTQQTNFTFEIIVHDDASTDDTVAIIKQYEAKHPHLFANIYQTENQLSKDIASVTKITFAAARGKYIALCEGDDYWNDPDKLQKQIDFLEQNDAYTACCSNVFELRGTDEIKIEGGKKTIQYRDLARGNCIYTNTVMFRNIIAIPDWFSKCSMCDWILWLLLSKKGDIYQFPEQMAVYRMHNSGIWVAKGKEKNLKDMIAAYDILLLKFENRFKKPLKQGAAQYYDQLLSILCEKKSKEIFYWSSKAFFFDLDIRRFKFLVKYFINILLMKPALSSPVS